MNSEGWKGADALSDGELAGAFWNAVSEPAPASDVKVGDVVRVEFTKDGNVTGHRTAVIFECMTSPTGDPQVRFEYTDEPPTSDVVIRVPQ